MLNKERKGTIAIRPGSEHQEPAAVFVGGTNGLDMTVCYVLNSEGLVFSDPEGSDLMDMNMNNLKRLRAEWHVQSAERSKRRWKAKVAELSDA